MALVILLEWPWWLLAVAALAILPLGLVLGRMESTHLGHALTDGHLVAGSGITSRTRTILQREGIIGWVVSQTIFQRRRNLATLTATTAAGSEQLVIRDVPLASALALARGATPRLLEPLLAPA